MNWNSKNSDDDAIWVPDNVVHKPWGHETIICNKREYVVKELYVKANSRLSLQYHLVKTETMFLIEGEGFLERVWDDVSEHPDGLIERHVETVHLKYMKPEYIRPGRIHRLFTKDKDCLVVEISSPHLDDVVRIEDDYGR